MFENSISPEESRRPAAKDTYADAVAKLHNLYTTDSSTLWGKTRVYYADYQQKSEVMRAQENRITTKLDDRQTVSALLDLAQDRGWERIKLHGSEAFRREAWVQAEVRGIETTGYKPKDTDLQEAARRQAAVKPVAPPPEKDTPVVTKRQPKAKAAEAGHRAEEKAIWGVVETAGKAAREQEATKPAEKPTDKAAAAAAA
jgi:Large polyvalent protein-associated domain 7